MTGAFIGTVVRVGLMVILLTGSSTPADLVSPGEVTPSDAVTELLERGPNPDADPCDVPDDLGGGVERVGGAADVQCQQETENQEMNFNGD